MIYDTVFPLADALQLDIKIYKHGNLYELRGEREFSFRLSPKDDMKIPLRIEGSTLETNKSALLAKVLTDFWIYLTFDRTIGDHGQLALYYLDMRNQAVKTLKQAVDGADFDTAMMSIKPITKKVFIKGAKDIEWTPVVIDSASLKKVS